jgi:hypothetical protein
MSEEMTPELLAERKAAIKDTGRCPYCDEELVVMDLGDGPFNDWDAPEAWLCANQTCAYRVKSRETMEAQGIPGGGYRLIYIPARDWCGPIADTRVSLLKGHPKG